MRTRTRRRATTTRSTRCAYRPTCPACSTARCSSSTTGRTPPRSIRAASTTSATSSSSEWRMHLGAGERTQDKIRRAQLEGSRYADRPPIGKPEIIERAQREQLMRFYHDWYRPDLMAVIVVGDVDRDGVVAMIKDRFSSLTAPSPETAASDLRRTGSRRDPLHRRHRQGDDRDDRAGQRPSTGAQPGLCRRLSRHHARSAVRRHARRPARRA